MHLVKLGNVEAINITASRPKDHGCDSYYHRSSLLLSRDLLSENDVRFLFH